MTALAYTSTDVETGAAQSTDREGSDLVTVTIPELVSIEERLAHQAHLGDLHPAHARQLAAVTAELDRRWSVQT